MKLFEFLAGRKKEKEIKEITVAVISHLFKDSTFLPDRVIFCDNYFNNKDAFKKIEDALKKRKFPQEVFPSISKFIKPGQEDEVKALLWLFCTGKIRNIEFLGDFEKEGFSANSLFSEEELINLAKNLKDQENFAQSFIDELSKILLERMKEKIPFYEDILTKILEGKNFKKEKQLLVVRPEIIRLALGILERESNIDLKNEIPKTIFTGEYGGVEYHISTRSYLFNELLEEKIHSGELVIIRDDLIPRAILEEFLRIAFLKQLSMPENYLPSFEAFLHFYFKNFTNNELKEVLVNFINENRQNFLKGELYRELVRFFFNFTEEVKKRLTREDYRKYDENYTIFSGFYGKNMPHRVSFDSFLYVLNPSA